MRMFVAGFCAGCSILWLQTQLLEPSQLVVIGASLVLFYCFVYWSTPHLKGRSYAIIFTTRSLVLGIVLGLIWGNMQASMRMTSRLPLLEQAVEAIVSGKVCSIPEMSNRQVRFELCIETLQWLSPPSDSKVLNPTQKKEESDFLVEPPKRVSLAWYRTKQLIKPAEKWQFTVKLKPPYSTLNPFGFDLERWSVVNQIDAYGYIQNGTLISEETKVPHASDLSLTRGLSMNSFRLKVIEKLRVSLSQSSQSGWHLALVTGYRKDLRPQDYSLLKSTGTAHLIAISGLHIGLVFFWTMLVTRWFWRMSYRLCLWLPAEKVALSVALLVTWAFTLFTGAELPTQRAAIAISLLVFSRSHLTFWTSYHLFCLTLFVLLLHDPISVLSEGFWLTVFALAIILWFLEAFRARRWYHWVLLQFVLSFGMSSFSAAIFGGYSTSAWLANLLAIPLISFVILPLDLLALVSLTIPVLCDSLFKLSDLALGGLIECLRILDDGLSLIHISRVTSSFWLVSFVSVFAAIRLNIRAMSLVVFANLIIGVSFVVADQKEDTGTTIFFMDVGQGLSVIIQHQSHWVVYDTAFGHEHFTVASSSLVPFLSRQGVSEIDLLMISHDDLDHSGGMDELAQNFKLNRVVLGELPKERTHMEGAVSEVYEPCDENKMRLGELRLHWLQTDNEGNDASCVLAVDVYGNRFLLTGDIEKRAELKLLEQATDFLTADVISMPHHGSKTSSTWSFIAQVEPSIAVASNGYLNRFKHPATEVVNRYQKMGTKVESTWQSGMISVRVEQGKPLKINQYRHDAQKFWNHSSSSDIKVNPVVN